MEDETITLACSVRHKSSAAAASRGTDTIRLPNLADLRVELLVEGEAWSTAGVRLVEGARGVTIEWWFKDGHAVSYALVVHARAAAIDVDRFIEIDSVDGVSRAHDFGSWSFESTWG